MVVGNGLEVLPRVHATGQGSSFDIGPCHHRSSERYVRVDHDRLAVRGTEGPEGIQSDRQTVIVPIDPVQSGREHVPHRDPGRPRQLQQLLDAIEKDILARCAQFVAQEQALDPEGRLADVIARPTAAILLRSRERKGISKCASTTLLNEIRPLEAGAWISGSMYADRLLRLYDRPTTQWRSVPLGRPRCRATAEMV